MTTEAQETRTVSELARFAYDCLEVVPKDDPNRRPGIVVTKDDSPEWIVDLVHAAHGDTLPDDGIYAMVRDALIVIADGTDDGYDPDDLSYSFADGAVDIYNADRLAWIALPGRLDWIEQARDDGLLSADDDILSQIAGGQYVEARNVYANVYAYLRDMSGERG